MRVQRHCIIDVDRAAVWKVVSDPDCYPEFIASLERWETVTEGPARKGCPLHGALEDRLGADQVGRNMTGTLKDLKRMVEP